MRLDHYIKIGDNDIHMAQLMYSLLTVCSLILLGSFVISRNVKKDLKNIQLTSLFYKEKK